MKKFQLPTIIVLVALAAALVLIFLGQLIPAGIICMLCYMPIVGGVKNITAPLNLAAALITDCTFAFLLWHYHSLLSAAALLFSAAGIFRLIFMRTMGHTRWLWFDAFCWLGGAGLYVGANVLYPSGWEAWVFPLPPLLFKALLSTSIVLDGMNFRRKLKAGFKVAPGVEAPDFELPDVDGNLVRLSDYRGKKIVLLLFVRGDWCPFCHMMLRAYQAENKLFAAKNVQLVTVSPDITATNKDMAERMSLDYVLLSDVGFTAVSQYGLRIQGPINGNKTYTEQQEIPLPASFLIDKTGVVRYIQRADDVGVNIRFTEVFDILDELQ